MNTLESLSCLLSTQLGSMEGSHSLMAAHDSGGSSLCTDDLQALFELAETLFGEEGSSNNSSQFDSSSATVSFEIYLNMALSSLIGAEDLVAVVALLLVASHHFSSRGPSSSLSSSSQAYGITIRN